MLIWWKYMSICQDSGRISAERGSGVISALPENLSKKIDNKMSKSKKILELPDELAMKC